ncbi:MAG: divalent-cation tolerance protein CutA [Puniceicoccaceae bacterium]|nr:MAG: divalent-cation tolerance protein CutA [Puniceicoccaceae bacterium]
MSDELRIGLTTCDSEGVAESLAMGLVERGLAACVMIDKEVRSIYAYAGVIHDEYELRLIIKFAARNAEKVEAYLIAHHDYDVPEWIVLRPEHVSQKYLKWATA